MKFISIISLATLAATSPVSFIPTEDVPFPGAQLLDIKAQAVGTTAKEFTQGGCRDIIFIWARGSNEAGNMGTQVGPGVADGLKSRFGDSRVAAEGVDYSASLLTNLSPGGADPKGIAEMERLIELAVKQCPNAQLVVGGYSQGAALTHRAVEDRSAAVKAKIAAAILFGDTRKKQDGGRIPNFDTSKTKIICNDGDEVCNGTLNVQSPHLDYARRVPEAVTWLATKLR